MKNINFIFKCENGLTNLIATLTCHTIFTFKNKIYIFHLSKINLSSHYTFRDKNLFNYNKYTCITHQPRSSKNAIYNYSQTNWNENAMDIIYEECET